MMIGERGGLQEGQGSLGLIGMGHRREDGVK